MSFCLFPIISPPLCFCPVVLVFILLLTVYHPSLIYLSLSPLFFSPFKTLSSRSLSHSFSIKLFKLSCLHLQCQPPSPSSILSLLISHCKHGEAVFCCFQYLFCFHREYDKPRYQVNIRLLSKNRLYQVSVVNFMTETMQFDWWVIHRRVMNTLDLCVKPLTWTYCVVTARWWKRIWIKLWEKQQ